MTNPNEIPESLRERIPTTAAREGHWKTLIRGITSGDALNRILVRRAEENLPTSEADLRTLEKRLSR